MGGQRSARKYSSYIRICLTVRVEYSVHALPAIVLKSEATFSASAIINGQRAKRYFAGYNYHGNHGDALYLQLFR